MNPQMTPPSTPDPVPADAAHDALDVLLRQIVGGYFVLTDGQGVVSKWSEPAELLFGRPSEDVLGQGFFATLIGAPLSPAAQTWRAFLDRGEPPVASGTVQIAGRHADGSEFPLEAVFVPVKLDEGFDFSRFLEDLAFDLPLNLMLLRMRRQHPVVVRALRHGIEPRPQAWEDRRTAGTLVVFKPLAPTPWVQAELARRDAERAAADGEAEQRLTNTDPGVQGGVADLDDAAAVVARLLSAMERIEDLERLTGGLPAQLEAARRDADTLRGDVRRALSGGPSRLAARQDARLAAASTTGAVERSALAPLREAVADLQDGSAELRRRLDAEDLAALRERIDGVVAREEPAALRAEEALSLAREALRRVEEVDRGAGTVLADVRAADHRVAALRTELVEVRDVAEAAGRGVDALRGELAGLREIAEAARAEAAAAVRAGEERAEAMQSDLAFALATSRSSSRA